MRIYPGQKPVFSNGIRFREGWEAVQDDERSGRLSTSHSVAMAKNVRDGFNSDLRLGIRASQSFYLFQLLRRWLECQADAKFQHCIGLTR